jgi:hypothetical protein
MEISDFSVIILHQPITNHQCSQNVVGSKFEKSKI